MAETVADLIAQLRCHQPTTDDIEDCVDWLRSRSLVGAVDARSRLRRALTEEPDGWTHGVAADIRKAIRDFIEFQTGTRPG
jgi:hypothetical protein